MTRGRKTTLAPAEQVGPEFVGQTPEDMAKQEVRARTALAEVDQRTAEMARTLGYEGALTVGTLEDEIRFYQRRTVEAILETGKRLLLLKEMTGHGNSSQIGMNFDKRLELLGFSRSTAYRFMQAAAKTAKSAKLAVLQYEIKSASAFLELVTHDDDVLENLSEMDNIDRMSASELRAALRQSEKDVAFANEKRAKAEKERDQAEKKLAGSRPVVVPMDERITPFQVEITERQSLIEKGIAAHLEASAALDAWWTQEVTSAPGYDPNVAVPMPRSVALVALTLEDGANRLAQMVGAVQADIQNRFGVDLADARQYLMQVPEGGDSVSVGNE